jgi:hypothetical protein
MILSRMVSSGLLRCVVLTRATRRNNPEDTILHSHRRENLKSSMILSFVFCATRTLLTLIQAGYKHTNTKPQTSTKWAYRGWKFRHVELMGTDGYCTRLIYGSAWGQCDAVCIVGQPTEDQCNNIKIVIVFYGFREKKWTQCCSLTTAVVLSPT